MAIRLQVLMHPSAHTPQQLDHVVRALEALGLEVTGIGGSMISAKATPAAFAQMFVKGAGSAPTEATDSMTPAQLPVPESLRESVARISVVPQHHTMNEMERGTSTRPWKQV